MTSLAGTTPSEALDAIAGAAAEGLVLQHRLDPPLVRLWSGA
ncbi:hypothetical protein [Candidatus Solirubrobacter pratensis]|nr:hypothetical protein [Candidatus Solirubrobacter pratensis]